MENQENSIQDDNSSIKNETELSSSENDSKPEMNETELDLSDTGISNNSKNSIKNTSLSEQNDNKAINELTTDLDDDEPEETKNEAKSIEILDLNQRASDDVDRPFSFSPQQASNSEKNESFTTSKIDDSAKQESSVKQKSEQEDFFPENTDHTLLGLNSQKLTKSSIISDSTELKLRKKYQVYERQPQKFQFKNISEQDLFKTINRLSAMPDRNLEPYKVRTIHDRVKDIDIDAVSLRLYSTKIHGRITMNDFYNGYFLKRIRPADPLVVSERLSAKKDTRVPDSCRTIRSSSMKRNDLCVSWAWKGYN
ncbi:hypothetical protein BpHYR1_023569 [Brachionus plicatilis]|uniref:Uncharacterized protein n=1 Tax=Brachionus plicatilis TaxID=10195 RepID=A0A3M7PFE9_BRAPC|nr:hypothetical protein BpHYR1_023569 [Brachionus plicatilis]